ncbi:hypothetical protein PVK06_048635 [Gossypium arboreum]|uniref:Uncharacterized protein n=1 Tax=Gossypium arboreum TaxID=29729 RepID=A0ABR0MH00_GOSAR|nr:hypothetical protein PVK06_048635 [Gossypium arboreum]
MDNILTLNATFVTRTRLFGVPYPCRHDPTQILTRDTGQIWRKTVDTAVVDKLRKEEKALICRDEGRDRHGKMKVMIEEREQKENV